jgi:hypothetical protein
LIWIKFAPQRIGEHSLPLTLRRRAMLILPDPRMPDRRNRGANARAVDRPRRLAVAIFALGVLLAGPAAAEGCSQHCDYWHYYGPYDFTYISPGLYGYPVCDRHGSCSPFLTYVYSSHWHGRVTVRPAHAGPVPTETRQ